MALQLAKGRASLHSGRGLIPREGRHSERNIRPGWKDSCSIGDDVLGRRFNVLGQQLDLSIVKADPKLRLWSLAAKGYTDLEISPASAKRAWTEAQTIAHRLGEAQWEARAEGVPRRA